MYKTDNYYDSTMVRSVSNNTLKEYIPSSDDGYVYKTKLFFGLSYKFYEHLIFEWNVELQELWIKGKELRDQNQNQLEITTCKKIETFYKKIYILEDDGTLHIYNYTDDDDGLISLGTGTVYPDLVKDMVFDKLGGKLVYATDSDIFIIESEEEEILYELTNAKNIKELRLTEFGNTLIALTDDGDVYQLGLDNESINEQIIIPGYPELSGVPSIKKLGPYGKFGTYYGIDDPIDPNYTTSSTSELITPNGALISGIWMWNQLLDGGDIQFSFARNSLAYTSTITNQSCIFDDGNLLMDPPAYEKDSKNLIEDVTESNNSGFNTSDIVEAAMNTTNIFPIEEEETVILSLFVYGTIAKSSQKNSMGITTLTNFDYLIANEGEIILRQGNIENNLGYSYFSEDFLYQYFNLFYATIIYSPEYDEPIPEETRLLYNCQLKLTKLVNNVYNLSNVSFPLSIYMIGKDEKGNYLHIENECYIQEGGIKIELVRGNILDGYGYWKFDGIYEYIQGDRIPEVIGSNNYYCVPLRQNTTIDYLYYPIQVYPCV